MDFPLNTLIYTIQEILEIPLLDIEKDLWEPGGYKCSSLTKLLENNGGILDISEFPRKYSQQRSICLRLAIYRISDLWLMYLWI